MKNNLFDSYVKEQMVNARPDVPSHIWDNIMAKKDRKKPLGFWFNNATKGFLIGLVLLTGAGVSFYFYNNKTNIKPINQGSEKITTIEVAQKNTISDENKVAPDSQTNAQIDPLVFENNIGQNNTTINKTSSFL